MGLDGVEIVKNRKTGKVFVLLDEIGSRYKVVTPEGKTVSLPTDLFEEDADLLTEPEIPATLTPEQMATLKAVDAEEELTARRLDEAEALQAAAAKREATQVKQVPPRRSPSRRRVKEDSRTGVKSRWNASRLSFYKLKIEPLGPKQSFIVSVEGVGDFQMTRRDFETVFNEVLLSKSYRHDGHYAYDTIPEKAEQFRVGADPSR